MVVVKEGLEQVKMLCNRLRWTKIADVADREKEVERNQVKRRSLHSMVSSFHRLQKPAQKKNKKPTWNNPWDGPFNDGPDISAHSVYNVTLCTPHS